MEMHVAQPPVQVAPKLPSAPPPPLRRKLHLPAEPLVFVAVLLALVAFMAHAMPGPAPEGAATLAPATVAQHSPN